MKKAGQRVCAKCGGAGPHQCSKCRVVAYCGRSCQEEHWKAHKPECKKWRKEAAKEAGVLFSSELELVTLSEQAEEECSICLEIVETSERSSPLACTHIFHRTCLNEWREHSKNAECPNCRKALPPGAQQILEKAISILIRGSRTKCKADHESAVALALLAITEDPSLKDAFGFLTSAMHIAGYREKKVLKMAAKWKHAHYASTLLVYASKMERQGSTDDFQVKLLERASKLNPGNSNVFGSLGDKLWHRFEVHFVLCISAPHAYMILYSMLHQLSTGQKDIMQRQQMLTMQNVLT
jgi:hypothetical protein